MKKQLLPLLSLVLLLTACGAGPEVSETGTAGAGENSVSESSETMNTFKQISAEEAKAMMDEHPEAIIVDVREQDEYDDGHVPGAILFPLGTITERTASEKLPEKDALLMVYCRSGNRSVHASEKLAELGYTNVHEFGGILDWPYDIEA